MYPSSSRNNNILFRLRKQLFFISPPTKTVISFIYKQQLFTIPTETLISPIQWLVFLCPQTIVLRLQTTKISFTLCSPNDSMDQQANHRNYWKYCRSTCVPRLGSVNLSSGCFQSQNFATCRNCRIL